MHETFNEKRVVELLEEHPGSELIAHPECEAPVLRHAHFIGSTKAMLDYTQKSSTRAFMAHRQAYAAHVGAQVYQRARKAGSGGGDAASHG